MSEKPEIQTTDTPVPIGPSPVPILEKNQAPLPPNRPPAPTLPESESAGKKQLGEFAKSFLEGELQNCIDDIGGVLGSALGGGSMIEAILGTNFVENKIKKEFNLDFSLYDFNKYLVDRNYIKSLPELDLEKMDPSERHLRFVFLRKVFAVFSAQIALTFGLICLSFSPPIKMFIILNSYLFFVFAGIFIITLIILTCFRQTALGCPANYIVLIIFTISESFFLLLMCNGFTRSVILTLMGMLCMLSFGITIFSLFNKISFNYCGVYWFSFLFIAVYYVVCGFGFNDWKITSICLGCVVLFALYFVFDSVYIINNLRMFYSPDDFIYVAASLYLDLLKVFYDMFRFVGRFLFAC